MARRLTAPAPARRDNLGPADEAEPSEPSSAYQSIVNAFNAHPDRAFRARGLHELLGMPTNEAAVNITRSRIARPGFPTQPARCRYRKRTRHRRVACPAMYQIEAALPTVSEYRALRAAVGWDSPTEAACREALRAAVFGVVARHAKRVVGMARLVGDGAMYAFIVDVAVHPDHQGAGLGRLMVNALTYWAREHEVHTTMLIASADVASFYKPLGFSLDPSSVMKYTTRGEGT